MAKGFASGLVHGVLVCAAGLAALSLTLPQPPRPKAAADPGPAVEALSVPAGSEFSRASDMEPEAPAPLTAEAARPAVPQVGRPADETAPAAADPVSLRPDTPAEAPAAPEIALPEPDPIDLPEPAGEAPIPVPPPGQVVVPGLDRAPERALFAPAPPTDASPASDTPAAPGQPADEPLTVEAAANLDSQPPVSDPEPQHRAAPAPGSGFDLSLPPDFDALHLTE